MSFFVDVLLIQIPCLTYFENLDHFGMSTPVTPRKNGKAFRGSGAAASSEWYDAKIPNCIDFDKPGTYFSL